ncbi:MAG: ArnT family glycosyltransferase [Phycisphaerae bacterium]
MPFSICVLIVLAVYGAGLSRDMSEPWVGMHDWNGAFFSQLARNFLRYPSSIHHGMPVVAVGEAVPPPAERSIYATHPPGLVWLLAAAFGLVGEAEWVARLVPVVASLATLWLLVWLVSCSRGRQPSVLAGLIYATMPMAVYFGRMVDHEALCLFGMMAALASWRCYACGRAGPTSRRWAATGWMAAITFAIWIDWAGVVFAGVFCVFTLLQRRARLIRQRQLILAWAVPAIAGTAMVLYLVQAGLAGRWADLVAIFLTRTTEVQGGEFAKDLSSGGGPLDYTLDNLTWPVIVLAVGGLAASLRRGRDQKSRAGASRPFLEDGLWTIGVTGMLWVAVFWRQFERHNYWLFYCGPTMAIYAGIAVDRLRRLAALSTRAGDVLCVIVLLAVVGWGLRTTDAYFQRRSYPQEDVIAWREIHDRRTRSGDRVLLYRNPVRVEQRGGYRFRNLVPPQMAYYLDQPFDVTADLEDLERVAPDQAVFIIPLADAARTGGRLDRLRHRWKASIVGSQMVFDLRGCRSERGRAGPG